MATKKKTLKRGPKPSGRDVRVGFPVSREEFEQIEAAAEAAGRKVTQHLRWVYFNASTTAQH